MCGFLSCDVSYEFYRVSHNRDPNLLYSRTYLTACTILSILVLRVERIVRYREPASERRYIGQTYILLLPGRPGEPTLHPTPRM